MLGSFFPARLLRRRRRYHGLRPQHRATLKDGLRLGPLRRGPGVASHRRLPLRVALVAGLRVAGDLAAERGPAAADRAQSPLLQERGLRFARGLLLRDHQPALGLFRSGQPGRTLAREPFSFHHACANLAPAFVLPPSSRRFIVVIIVVVIVIIVIIIIITFRCELFFNATQQLVTRIHGVPKPLDVVGAEPRSVGVRLTRDLAE